jgi:hypothetical protein
MGSTKFVRFRLPRSAFRTTLLRPQLLQDQPAACSASIVGWPAPLWLSQAVVACKPQTVTKLKKRYLWSWAIAGVTFPLLILFVGLFMPKPPEWNPFQEAKISPAQGRIAVVIALLWPTEDVAEFLALAVTDCGVDSGAALPSNHHNCGFTSSECCCLYRNCIVSWFFAEVFSIFFQGARETQMKGYLREPGAYKLEWASFRKGAAA